MEGIDTVIGRWAKSQQDIEQRKQNETIWLDIQGTSHYIAPDLPNETWNHCWTIKTTKLNFLDMQNYLPPGTSLREFYESQQVETPSAIDSQRMQGACTCSIRNDQDSSWWRTNRGGRWRRGQLFIQLFYLFIRLLDQTFWDKIRRKVG